MPSKQLSNAAGPLSSLPPVVDEKEVVNRSTSTVHAKLQNLLLSNQGG